MLLVVSLPVSMRSAQLMALLDSSTADAITVSIIKPVLRVSGDSSVVIDHRYIFSLKVSQLKDILQALRDAHGPCVQFSTTGNKDLLVLRVLVALYPQHASIIMDPTSGSAINPQPDSRPASAVGRAPPLPGQAQPTQLYPTSSFSAIPQMNGASGMTGPPGSFHATSHQPSTSPRVQVHLRAAGTPASALLSHIRAPSMPQPLAVHPLFREAVSRWSHPMFQPLAFEAFAFTHPVTNFQGALPFDKPQITNSVEKILIIPFTRRGVGGNSSFTPFQLQPGVSVAVSWNNCPVEIPKFVTVKSKLASATIHPHPMSVPQIAPFHKLGPNRLVMTGGGAENVIGIALILVRHRAIDELEALVRSHPMSKITKRPEFNQDEDCAATFTPVQLKDPLSFCRIQIPVKTVKCKHVQCFDLATFIQYCERSGIWYCPCCPSKPGLSINDVYVDQFFLDMIEGASAHDTNTVYLKPDGSWTTSNPDLAITLLKLPTPAQSPSPPPSKSLTQRIRVFPDGIQGGNSWMFELPVGSTVKTLKAAIEARCQLPHELFNLHWHERKLSLPDARQSPIPECGSTPSPSILVEMKEISVRDDDQVRVFGPGQASHELALQNEAFYSMNWLIDKMHARAFLSFRLSPAKTEELYCILNMLVDELNSNEDSEWRKNPLLSLSDHDLKLLAAFAPSSQQDMQALLPHKIPEFWASYHQIFLKSISDYHQLGRNRHSVSSQAASQSATQPRPASYAANGPVERAATVPAADNSDGGDLSARQNTLDVPPASGSSPALQLSRVIGQQDAADRLRAAADWLDARSDTPCSDDLPMAAAPSSGRRDSITDDDMPLVLPPQHLLAPGLLSSVDVRSALAYAAQGFPRQVGGSSGVPVVASAFEHRHETQRVSGDVRRHVGQTSIGQKRPAPNSMGSSASNAIVIDDD